MKINVRYFAAARELAGTASEEVEIEAPSCSARELVEQLSRRHARLAPYLSRMRFAANGDFVAADARFRDGDEVDVLPPVAGGNPVALADVRGTPLSVDECLRAVTHPGAGGVCLFVGVVRDHAEGKSVARLDYEAHVELAIKETKRILAGVAEEHAGARLAATHRVGELAVGDLAVVVAASAAHRDEAFAACRKAIDRIKESVPIWKKEWAPDGSAIWVNLEDG
jgi:molybdopterin synthase catalytic subunit